MRGKLRTERAGANAGAFTPGPRQPHGHLCISECDRTWVPMGTAVGTPRGLAVEHRAHGLSLQGPAPSWKPAGPKPARH